MGVVNEQAVQTENSCSQQQSGISSERGIDTVGFVEVIEAGFAQGGPQHTELKVDEQQSGWWALRNTCALSLTPSSWHEIFSFGIDAIHSCNASGSHSLHLLGGQRSRE
jgi:hypothetical protein